MRNARCVTVSQTISRPRRGVATFFAILLLLIIASSLVIMGMTFAASARRTRAQADDAQLRQLVTAGAIDALKQVQTGDAAISPRKIKLPDDATDQPASINIDFAGAGDRMIATVLARLGPRHMEQRVTFEQRDGKWSPVEASLDAAAPATKPATSQSSN